MVAPVPKTKFDEFLLEIESIEKLPRQEAIERLLFFATKVSHADKKNSLGKDEYLWLKARIARLKGNIEEVRGYKSGLCSFLGDYGMWSQFENLVHIGYLHDAYLIIRDFPVEGCELTNAAWLSLCHAMNADFDKVDDCISYIKRAYPDCTEDHKVQLTMAKTAYRISQCLSNMPDKFSITEALQFAIAEAVPATMLKMPGVDYKSSILNSPDGEEVLIEMQLLPNLESSEELAEISIAFSRALQEKLSDDITDKVMLFVSFSDDAK